MQGIRKPRYVVLDSQMMHGGINMSGIVQKENSFIKTLDEIGKIRYVRKKNDSDNLLLTVSTRIGTAHRFSRYA